MEKIVEQKQQPSAESAGQMMESTIDDIERHMYSALKAIGRLAQLKIKNKMSAAKENAAIKELKEIGKFMELKVINSK